MQVNTVAIAAGAKPDGPRREALLPDILQLLPLQSDTVDRRESLSDIRAERQRRKDAELRELAADAAHTPRVSETIVRAERKMLPGTQAARREQLRSQTRAQAQQVRHEFRRALADASARGPNDRVASTQRAPTDTRPPAGDANQGSEPPASGKTSPAASSNVTDGAKSSAQPATAGSSTGSPSPGGQVSVTPPTTPATATPFATGADESGTGGPTTLKVSAVARVSATTLGSASGTASSPAAAPTSRSESGPGVAADLSRSASVTERAGRSRPDQAAPRGNSDANVARMVRLIHTRIGKDRSVATLRLDPPRLGTVRLHMDLRNEQLTLRIDTQSVAARQLLAEQLEALRQNLEAAGIQLERVEVRSAAVAREAPDNNTPHQPDAGTGREDGSARADTEAAGGEPQPGTDSHPTEPPEERSGELEAEPAAETLVNILA